MKWEQLLSKKRVGQNWKKKPNINRSEFQIDYDRIIFSTAFRRLQDKTQVFPLAKSDYVRTRLTHSLEVSCIARNLGMQIGSVLCKRNKIKDIDTNDIATIMAAAALSHDIGNPPFGHSGEDSIRNWFNTSSMVKNFKLNKKEYSDISNFEGNAQGFRLLTVLQMPENVGGMRLTCATLGAFTKYPIESNLIKSKKSVSYKKYNFYQSEKYLFKEIAEELGLNKEGRKYAWCRHPLAFLIEACDDICYRIIDYEDGYKLGLVNYESILNSFSELADKKSLGFLNQLNDDKSKIEFLRAKSFQKLLEEISTFFLDNETKMLSGKFNDEIINHIPSAKILKKLKDETVKKVYSDRGVLEIEAAGFEVANGILEYFGNAVLDKLRNNNKISPHSRKLLQLLPTQFHPDNGMSDYLNLLKVLDFFAGMTDSYAVSLYKTIKGISLPGE
ncbi:MAG: deoxyguanosinetriphosphate triphosphohydrolase [Melioribacteraceae bacterium]